MNENTFSSASSVPNVRQAALFDADEFRPDAPGPPEARPRGTPRLRRANRRQVKFRACAWNDLLPEGHSARIAWQFAEGLDLSPLLVRIKSVEDQPGTPPIDPRILTTLWLYATLRGVGSARELDRRCGEHGEVPFQWICGGVSVNHHTLSDFRTQHVEFLDGVLTQSVAALLEQELVEMDRVAQDGMRVRASAGASSFRRKPTLEECLADAQATVMKMPDGGFRPAFNVQFATDTKTQVITGVEVTNSGSDLGEMLPMVEQLQERYDKTPDEYLTDGGFAKKEDIEQLDPDPDADASSGTLIYIPVQKPKKDNRDPHQPCAGDSPKIAAWRRRMGTEEAKEIYKERAATAECVNAIARNRGLRQFNVRGLTKAKAVILWYVIAHNLMRAVALRAEREKVC